MKRTAAIDCVRTARESISLAIRACGAADTAHLNRAVGLLEAAVINVRQAEAEIRASVPLDPAKLRRETNLLKRQTAIMMRVIDGCAALRRGLSARLGDPDPAYTPQGRPVVTPPSAAAFEMQG
jgi:hypothetical protein